MATIAKPQALVFQEFAIVPSEITDPLRAHVSGPNAKLHRYSEADEKALIDLGAYDRLEDADYTWPGKTAGSLVDQDYTRLFIDDALLLYHEDLIGIATEGRGVVAPVSGRPNWIRSSTLSYKSNGSAYPRSSLFLDRDVKVGDRVYVRGVEDPDGECIEHELWTYVTGFASDEVAAVLGAVRADAANQDTTAAAAEIEQIAGPENCITVTVDGSEYDGLASGDVEETYTIEVIKSSISGCNAARLRVTSASGRDDVAELEPEDFGVPTEIGTRGLLVTFDSTPGEDCSSQAEFEEVVPTELVVGQKWRVTVAQAFERVCGAVSGAYTGDANDTYIVEVVTGGLFEPADEDAALPAIKVTTTKGLDFSGPTEVTGANVSVAIGTHGLTFSFVDCYGDDEESASSEGEGDLGGDNTLAGLRKGDKFYITVTSPTNGPVRTLILRHDLPEELWTATDLDLRLFIQKNIEVSENRLSDPPLVNYEQETTQVIVKAGITAYDATWTDGGVEQAMPVYGGTLYLQYREFLDDLADEIGSINDVADIDTIPGQLDEDNPLKWGVYNALLNSNGTAVKYTAVEDPDDLDSWQLVIDRVDGNDTLYNFVPLTYDVNVLNLFKAHVLSESSAESGNWKGMFVNLLAKTVKMVVGLSDADDQALNPTSTDGEEVLAVLEDNPQASGTQYTRLRVPAGNAGFVEYGVQSGDIVRFLYTTDSWGEQSYTEFVVDEVLSENILLLQEGHDSAVSEPQKIEIWHTLEKDEVKDDLKQQAQAFAHRRVCAVWPDLVGVGGNTVSGYFLCCALAGLASGVPPHQPLTNVEVSGFDDYSRSTKFFSATQLDDLQDGGVWIVTEDRDGTPHTYHALTTDTLDVNRREEMIRRNVDSISYLFLRRLRPFIGRTNNVRSMRDKLEYECEKTIEYLVGNGFTVELGGQLISGTVRFVRQHPLLADRVEIVLDLVVPAPINNIELHIVV